jgi:CheY-like chemotaxis protein
MAEKHDDSIGRLLKQVRALNETLDSNPTFQAAEWRELRLLRLTLMSVANNSIFQLKQIVEAIGQLDLRIGADLAVFSESGSLSSFTGSLAGILDLPPDDSIFFNASVDAKFLDARQEPIAPAELPWNKELSADEHFEPRILLHSEKNKELKWIACLLSRLIALEAAQAARVACFMDVSGLVKIEQRLAGACLALAGEKREIANADQGIDQIRDLLAREKVDDIDEADTFAPRIRERPPVLTSNENGEPRKVLVVDDIAINQKLLAKRLQKLNLECEFASNGQKGVDMALTGNYALIFMDCDMPIMDGFKATKLIRRAELESGRHVPIIALTSYDREDDRERCLSAGMDEYLSKGASPNLLQEVVEWCLRRSQVKSEQDMSIDEYEEELDIKGLSKTFSKEELNEIFDLLLPSTNTLMRCLRMSMDERDVRSTGHFAYSLKGPFASLGMVMTCKLASRLNDAAEESQWEEANEYYEMLRRNCEAVRLQLEERAARQS